MKEENNYQVVEPLSNKTIGEKNGYYDSMEDANKAMIYVDNCFKKAIKKMILEDDEIPKEKKDQFLYKVLMNVPGIAWSLQTIYGKVKISIEEEYDQIIDRIKKIIEKVKKFDSDFHYLKTKEISVIKNLYEALKLDDNLGKEIKNMIIEALIDNYKVEFVDYEGKFANTDYFTSERYENLDKPETTLQALVYSEDENVCICKGIHKNI